MMNQELQDFLATKLQKIHELTIVGPMLKASHLPSLERREHLILIDGARNHFCTKKASWLLIGDADSAKDIYRQEFDFLLPTQKPYSDLAAVLHSLPNTLQKVDFFGLGEGRFDHQLFNLAEMAHWLKEQRNFSVAIDESTKLFAPGNYRQKIDGTFSILHFQPLRLSLRGCVEYPLEHHHLPIISSFTLSNRGFGEVEIECDESVVLYLAKNDDD